MKEKIKGDFILWQGLLLHHNCIYDLESFVRAAFARQPILSEKADIRTISWCQTPAYSKGFFLLRRPFRKWDVCIPNAPTHRQRNEMTKRDQETKKKGLSLQYSISIKTPPNNPFQMQTFGYHDNKKKRKEKKRKENRLNPSRSPPSTKPWGGRVSAPFLPITTFLLLCHHTLLAIIYLLLQHDTVDAGLQQSTHRRGLAFQNAQGIEGFGCGLGREMGEGRRELLG